MKKTLVIGASTNPARYSNIAIHRLSQFGHPIEALGLKEGTVNGIEIFTEKKPIENVHTVTLYVGPKNQPEYYQYIIGLQPKRVIFNPGTENPEFFSLLKENEVAYEVACTLVLLSTNQY
ncbi:MAG: CoA-binding protein [Flavobacteriaceae bacterium]|nr:CoA-binding protein [Flavobacteriaceae bacterium]